MIQEMMSYPFMVRAVLGGAAVSLCAALLGVSLVLRRYSMIGDGLSHVSFGALSIAIALGWSPLKVSIPLVIIAAFFLLRITENGKVKSDAAIAVLSASSLAAGNCCHVSDYRNDYRYQQLYVRQYSCYEQGGCVFQLPAVVGGIWHVCAVL